MFKAETIGIAELGDWGRHYSCQCEHLGGWFSQLMKPGNARRGSGLLDEIPTVPLGKYCLIYLCNMHIGNVKSASNYMSVKVRWELFGSKDIMRVITINRNCSLSCCLLLVDKPSKVKPMKCMEFSCVDWGKVEGIMEYHIPRWSQWIPFWCYTLNKLSSESLL